MEAVFLAMVLMLSIFLGFELISKVPATLHTPLMSGANAISGITIVGALISAGGDSGAMSSYLGAAAVMTSAAGQERFASALASGVRRRRR